MEESPAFSRRHRAPGAAAAGRWPAPGPCPPGAIRAHHHHRCIDRPGGLAGLEPPATPARQRLGRELVLRQVAQGLEGIHQSRRRHGLELLPAHALLKLEAKGLGALQLSQAAATAEGLTQIAGQRADVGAS
jgi:hypothetical protein